MTLLSTSSESTCEKGLSFQMLCWLIFIHYLLPLVTVYFANLHPNCILRCTNILYPVNYYFYDLFEVTWPWVRFGKNPSCRTMLSALLSTCDTFVHLVSIQMYKSQLWCCIIRPDCSYSHFQTIRLRVSCSRWTRTGREKSAAEKRKTLVSPICMVTFLLKQSHLGI